MTLADAIELMGLMGSITDSSVEDVSESQLGRERDGGGAADETLPALELKKPPTFVVKGAVAVGVTRLKDEAEVAASVLLGAAATDVSTFHSLRGGSLAAILTGGSIFHILNAPQPDTDFFSSLGFAAGTCCGNLVSSESLAAPFVCAMKSRNALAQVSEASRASLASESSCLVSSNSALAAFISCRSASISSTRESWGRKSCGFGGDACPKTPEKRLELTGGLLLVDDDKSGRVMVCESGLPGVLMADRLDKKTESEMDDIRWCPFIRVPVSGVKEARLLDDGVENAPREVSIDMFLWPICLFSV